MKHRTYYVLFWSVLGLTVLVFSWYAYLYSRGLVTFTLQPDINASNVVTGD